LPTYATDPGMGGVCKLALMWAFRSPKALGAVGLTRDPFSLSLGLI
jgi:hypothetical protein